MTRIEQLERLARLREQGFLSTEEFEREKALILGREEWMLVVHCDATLSR